MKGSKVMLVQGSRYGKLTVIWQVENSPRGYRRYLCLCDCGRECKPYATALRRGKSTSCGYCHKHLYCRPDSALKRMFRTYKHGAAVRGFCFELSFEQFSELAGMPCYYCGVEPAVNSYSEEAKVKQCLNGIDRVRPAVGYTWLNTVACCKLCNNAKWDLSLADFTTWLRRVSTRLKEWGE